MQKLLFFLVILNIFSCSSNTKGNLAQEPAQKKSIELLDSISKRTRISLNFIKKHTVISEYIYDTMGTVKGDSIYFLPNQIALARINYSTGTGDDKLLLVVDMKTGLNTDCIEIFKESDADGDNFMALKDYQFTKQNKLIITASYVHGQSGIEDTTQREISTYSISPTGKYVKE